MRDLSQISSLLDRLDKLKVDALEAQDLDFKEWPADGRQAIRQVVDMAVCMANGGGGTVVFGVRDHVVGRAKAILGTPAGVDPHQIKREVYERTAPKLTPEFAVLAVPEGTGGLLVMQVHGGLPPYTTTAGAGTARRGKDCVPLTGDLRDRLMVERGDADATAFTVAEPVEPLLSPAALERLRDLAQQEQAPAELLRKSDLDLLGALDVLRDGQLTKAGLLLAGNAEAIGRHLPHFGWTHERMTSATAYADRADGQGSGALALPLALQAIEARILADNPITTVEHGLYHFEFRAYPGAALREALLNALCHLDLRLASPVLVKQFPRRLEISNPGGLIGGITSANILHHPPLARNPLLVQALSKLRLVNRSNLGVGRMFEAMLMEGKAPPLIVDQNSAVRVVFRRQQTSAPFRQFIADEAKAGRVLDVDHLLLLRHLLDHADIEASAAAVLCQRHPGEMRDILDDMVAPYGYLERGGLGRNPWWRLLPALRQGLQVLTAALAQPMALALAKTRVLAMLKQRMQRGEPGLTNAEVRALTGYSRQQVNRLIHVLPAGMVQITGHGRGARYVHLPADKSTPSRAG